MPLKLLHRNISQRANAGPRFLQDSDTFFAVCPPLVVLSAGMLVFDHGVADHEGCARRYWQKLELKVAAVQH